MTSGRWHNYSSPCHDELWQSDGTPRRQAAELVEWLESLDERWSSLAALSFLLLLLSRSRSVAADLSVVLVGSTRLSPLPPVDRIVASSRR